MDIKNIVDDCLKEASSLEYKEPAGHVVVLSFGVPEELKRDFDELQILTGKKFGQVLQKMMKKVIFDIKNKRPEIK